MKKKLMNRSYVYHFLARIFGKKVDQDFISLINSCDFENKEDESKHTERMNFMSKYLKNCPECAITDLAKEYEKIFLSGGETKSNGIKPYESVYIADHNSKQDNIEAVKNMFREEGFLKPDDFANSADHIALELEFMGILCEKAAAGLLHGDKESVNTYIQKQNKFLENHLLKWAPEFAKDVEGAANEGFYKEASITLHNFLKEEKNSI